MPEFTKFRWPANESNIKDEYIAREKACLEYISWEALKVVAQTLRSTPCEFGEQYRFGARHVVREFVFEDDVHWIARVSLPDTNLAAEDNHIPKPISSSWTPEAAAVMQSELDTMSFLRENTDIPIPLIFFSDTSATNPAGAPYVFMECIKGDSGMDMPGRYEIPPKYRAKYLEAETSIMVKLWKIDFDKIGSIFYNADSSTYEIGPLVNGLGGPFETAAEYYRAWAMKNMSVPGATSDLAVQIHQLAPLISRYDQGPFRIFHPDFAVHNVIVDEEYNILSVIDWEFAFTGPFELATQQALRHQTYPLSILAKVPGATDMYGNVIDEKWCKAFRERDEFIVALSRKEKQLGVSLPMSTSVNSVEADVWWLLQMWAQKKPWILNYPPGLKEGVDTILKIIKERGTMEADLLAQVRSMQKFISSTSTTSDPPTKLGGSKDIQ